MANQNDNIKALHASHLCTRWPLRHRLQSLPAARAYGGRFGFETQEQPTRPPLAHPAVTGANARVVRPFHRDRHRAAEAVPGQAEGDGSAAAGGPASPEVLVCMGMLLQNWSRRGKGRAGPDSMPHHEAVRYDAGITRPDAAMSTLVCP